MPIRLECTGCRSILEVKDALAGKQGACPKCGAVIMVPAQGQPADGPRLLADATGAEMIETIHRRNKSAVLVVFETPEAGNYDLTDQAGANVRCYRTADMDDQQLMQVLSQLGQMSQGKSNARGGVGLASNDQLQPYACKGDPVGMSLDAFKQKYARDLGAGLKAPFCSDAFAGQANQALLSEPWHAKAGIVHARVDLPSENHSPTIAGVDTEILLYQFVDGRLFRITALFDTDSFHHIREALCDKQGPPADELRDPLGYVWENQVSRIELIRGTIRPKKPSMLHYIHRELFARFQTRTPTRTQDI